MNRKVRFPLIAFTVAAVITASDSCTPNALLNINAPTASFIGPNGIPTARALQVGFINNTPFRAIFTFGAYDQLDKDSLPTGFAQLRLEGNTASAQLVQPCRKTFAIGGEKLIQLIDENRNDPSISITDERALVRGVNFSGAALGDPLEAEPTEGTAEPTLLLNGVDFTCLRTDIRQTTGTGVLLFTFEQDAGAPGGFRIDFSFVQP
ncbi:MAG: hypothetical protein AAB385_10380 [Planctomycetota bacterium]